MAEVKKRDRTKAEHAMDARLDEIMAEPIVWPYPQNVTLIATDTTFAAESIAEAAAQGKAMVLFSPSGDEVVLTPSRPEDMTERPWESAPEVLD